MKTIKSIIPLLTVIFTILFTGAAFAAQQYETEKAWPNPQLLVEAADLPELLLNPDVVLIDMRAEGYSEGHIPGSRMGLAVFRHW